MVRENDRRCPGLIEGGVVAIARGLDPTVVAAVADGLLRGGVRLFEVTLNDPEAAALASIATCQARRRNAAGGGGGTVLSVEAALEPSMPRNVPCHAAHRPGARRLGRDPRDAVLSRSVQPDRDPGRVARGRRRREAVPGLGRRPGIRPRVSGSLPGCPTRPDWGRYRCHRSGLHPGRRDRRGLGQLADRRRSAGRDRRAGRPSFAPWRRRTR